MKNLSKKELMSIEGGTKEPSFFEVAGFIAGYTLGSAIDAVHGFYDGLWGMDAH